MVVRVLVATLALVAIPLSASAREDSQSKRADYSTKRICKVQGQIGTRLGTVKRCRTQAEWDQARTEQRRTIERTQSSTSACLRGGICSN